MLALISEPERKTVAQEKLEKNLKNALELQGTRNIGFQSGNVDLPIYSAGAGQLWVAFGGPVEGKGTATRRYWNAFGVFSPDRPVQSISVEINIPIDGNSAQVAGFFAEDRETGDIFLMHSGKLGGGRPGIGKSAFLVKSMPELIEVTGGRSGIAVCKLDGPDLADRIWAFVRTVQRFKDSAAEGAMETPEFKRRLKEYDLDNDLYKKEFSGKKSGTRSGAFEYITYHGDIVDKLYNERIARSSPDEQVSRSLPIDLYVKKDGALSEVYEIKTGVGRQMLYTAIGQIVTHATNGNGEVAKFLVIPADENVPVDLERAMATLDIKVRRFRLRSAGPSRVVELD